MLIEMGIMNRSGSGGWFLMFVVRDGIRGGVSLVVYGGVLRGGDGE